jgi:hypothetical protein
MAFNDEEGLNGLRLAQFIFAKVKKTLSLQQSSDLLSGGPIDKFLNEETFGKTSRTKPA